MRRSSPSLLLRVVLLGAAWAFYCAPLHFLSHDATADPVASAQRVQELRLWLSLALTLIALVGVISVQLLVVSCIHAALHFAQYMRRIPLPPITSDVAPWCWQDQCLSSCIYEYGCITTFLLMLRYLIISPASTLSSLRRHSRQLKRFFQQHDHKYVPLVDRLLEDYTGNERLLFARIRKIYRQKLTSEPLHTP